MTTQPDQLETTIERPAWLPEMQWPFRLRAVPVDGCRLHLTDEGSGPVLLFVHTGMWSFVWRDVIADLSRDFRCIAIDFPGFGLTQAPVDYPIGLETNAKLLEAVVDRLGLTGFALVAHDLGGLVGLVLAAHRPELIRGLVVLNGFGWPPSRLL
jgi:haloalkane dehalogenase